MYANYIALKINSTFFYRNLIFGTFNDVMPSVFTWTQRELQFEYPNKTCQQLPLTQGHY